jgi:5'-nucleotidase
MMKTVLIDMDGVLVELNSDRFKKEKLVKGFFLNNRPIPGAVQAFQYLNRIYDCHIVSTPVWDNPHCWMEKRMWVDKHLGGCARKKLTLTHHKNYFKGDFLIDDSVQHGVKEFQGEHIHFGSFKFPNWVTVLSYLNQQP